MNYTPKERLSLMIHWQNKTVRDDGIAVIARRQKEGKHY
jgi:hypothetical protein